MAKLHADSGNTDEICWLWIFDYVLQAGDCRSNLIIIFSPWWWNQYQFATGCSFWIIRWVLKWNFISNYFLGSYWFFRRSFSSHLVKLPGHLRNFSSIVFGGVLGSSLGIFSGIWGYFGGILGVFCWYSGVFGWIWGYLGVFGRYYVPFLSFSFSNGSPILCVGNINECRLFSTVPKNVRHHLGFERARPQFSSSKIFPNLWGFQGFSIL